MVSKRIGLGHWRDFIILNFMTPANRGAFFQETSPLRPIKDYRNFRAGILPESAVS